MRRGCCDGARIAPRSRADVVAEKLRRKGGVTKSIIGAVDTSTMYDASRNVHAEVSNKSKYLPDAPASIDKYYEKCMDNYGNKEYCTIMALRILRLRK